MSGPGGNTGGAGFFKGIDQCSNAKRFSEEGSPSMAFRHRGRAGPGGKDIRDARRLEPVGDLLGAVTQ